MTDAATSERDVMLQDVVEGLTLPQKELSPKYFYDTRGSELFEEITRTAEYYPTRTERALLEAHVPRWVQAHRPATLVELGAGSATKSRIVLDAMEAQASGNVYVPIDVSADFLHETAARLREEYDALTVRPAVADMTAPVDLPEGLPGPRWMALLGSTLGNFDESHAEGLLRRVAGRIGGDDRFLLGVDLRPGAGKSVERLEQAYNDAAGVTAAFNLNVLRVLNRELDADFNESAFRHRAFYNADEGRMEMHLVAREAQRITFPGADPVEVEAGESIRTEISCKYDRPTVDALFARAGMVVDRWEEDAGGFFALVLGRSEAAEG